MFSIFLKRHLLTKKFFTFFIGSTYLTSKINKNNNNHRFDLISKNIKFPSKKFDSCSYKKINFPIIKENEQIKTIPSFYSLYSNDNFKFLIKNISTSFSNFVYFLVLNSRKKVAFCEVPQIKKPYLGCSIRSCEDEPQGMRIVMVKTDSPAEKAGLKVKDLILEIEGKSIRTINEYNAVVGLEAGKKKFKILRKEGDNENIIEIYVDLIYSE
jgi:C-terminal processing protease CtpA/Prc